jgi:ABC-type bacteriocin/lantibiotic exporter with double-glycine peptidase domain
LDNIWLAYPGSKEYALKGISLNIPKGSIVAIVGPEACGKSSIARLVLGTARPQVSSVYYICWYLFCTCI